MTFAMVITRQPKSSNPGANRPFQEALGDAARQKMVDKALMEGNRYIRINWFFNKPGGPDVDNILKQIVDSMKTIVYADDALFVKALACKYDLRTGRPQLSDRNVPVDVSDVYDELLKQLATRWDGILYIEVGKVQSSTVVFGQIDGGVA